MLVISIITTLFTLVSVCIIAYLSIASMKTAAINKAEQDLVSKRVLITKELNNYIGTIEKQAVVMAKDVSIQDAASGFSRAFLATNAVIESKNELSRYYNQQFLNAYNTQNIKSVDVQDLFNKLPPLSLDFQTKYIALNQYPLGEKDTLCRGQVKLATVLESFQYKRSDSFGVNPPLY